MPSLVIPEIYQPGLEVLLRLSEEEIRALSNALESIPPTVHLKKDIASAVVPQLTNLKPQEVENLTAALYSLFEVRALAEIALEDFVRDLIVALAATGKPGLAVAELDRERLIANLKLVLNIDSLNLFAKVNALQRTHQHIFHDARILTDLRPVFAAPDQEPQGMIIEHTLKIHFHDGSRHKELYMALDSDDIARLRKAIERAEAKATSLGSLLNSKDIKQLYLS